MSVGTFWCRNSDGEHTFENVSVQLYEYARPNGILAVIWREKPDMTDEIVATVAGVGEFLASGGLFPDWSQHVLMVQDDMLHPLGSDAQSWGRFWHQHDLHARLPRHFDAPVEPT